VGVENLAFVATKICLFSILFSKSTREVFTDKVALSKQVCLWFTDAAAIPYYNPSPPVRGHALDWAKGIVPNAQYNLIKVAIH
jgi:hypothetical protein